MAYYDLLEHRNIIAKPVVYNARVYQSTKLYVSLNSLNGGIRVKNKVDFEATLNKGS